MWVDRTTAGEQDLPFAYDTLIVAAGSRYSYFGHDEWRQFALEVKSLESAVAVRRRIFTAFEAAEIEQDPGRREAWLTWLANDAAGVEVKRRTSLMTTRTFRWRLRMARRGAAISSGARAPVAA